MKDAKPSRKDLLKVISELQALFGKINATYHNDRLEDRASKIAQACEEGMEMCITARAFDPPS